ncbi:hypothetical protein HYC85_013166 [Camellia sinensis]|uniref:Uncharacterized protein n=1 Tax=Camellia sinensis TaxID=4442 RepID=A0A7J7H2M9_CAMSI|nr:hypothetical protein HYC85_013166 [Camellia sinensis]
MQAVTPFSFIDNFLRKINADKVLPRSSIFRSTQLILSIRKECTIISSLTNDNVCGNSMQRVQAFLGCSSSDNICCNRNSNSGHSKRNVSSFNIVIKCVELINESSLASGFMKGPSSSVPSVPQSPIGVLHPACLSYKADGTTIGSCPSSSHSTPDSKRRKLNRPFSLCLLSFFLDLVLSSSHWLHG